MSEKLEQAFRAVPRDNFLQEDAKNQASLDMPIPIGYGQTNSQPTTVRKMLEWLDVRPGQHILDVGSGSGWTTALLAYLTGDDGDVVAVEKVPELVRFGKVNCEKLNIANVRFHQASNVFGWPQEAPYDRILVSAAAESMPSELQDQLAGPGRMVIPIKNSIWIIDKDNDGKITSEERPGFAFVPLLD